MIKSMTGFGKAQLRAKSEIFIAEIKTLNHKFLEVTPKLPNSLGIFDERIKDLIKSRVKRGKVYFNLVHDAAEESGGNIVIDESLARNYCNKLKRLKKHVNIEGSIKLSDVIAFPGVVSFKPSEKNVMRLWPAIKKVTEKALERLVKDREKEGGYLCRDMVGRVNRIKKIVSEIKKSAFSNVKNYKKRLAERIKELSGNHQVESGRIEMEVALFAKNTDVTEELTRLSNHILNFTRTIRKNGEVGKKLDFIAQELHRETNTIGSKSGGFNISKGVIEAKTEIEKIREQLKNIE